MTKPALPAPARDDSRDIAIEGLRGLAAIVVLCRHLMLGSVGNWSPPQWLMWPFEASAAVMVFFVLSGYVIGLSNRSAATRASVRDYAWRRMVRVVPINAMAVLLACATASGWDWLTAATNLFFLQNYADYAGHWVLPLPTNGNLWSLNHEVVYYALFVVIWLARCRLSAVAVGAVGVLLLGWYTKFAPVFLACYAAGFLFWLAGLTLAWRAPRGDAAREAWPSALLLAIITWKLQVLQHLVSGFPMPLFSGPTVKLYYLDFLPVAVWLVAAVAQRNFPLLRWIKATAFAVPAFGLFAQSFAPGRLSSGDFAATAAVYVLAVVLAGWRPSLQAFRVLAPVGAISFALYAFASPLQHFVFAQVPLPANALGFSAAAALVILISVCLAWFFERRVQPAIRRVLMGKSTPASRSPLTAPAGLAVQPADCVAHT